MHDNKLFKDVDECLTNNGGCNQTCTNTIGSFECSCSTGFTLAPNNQDCLAGNLLYELYDLLWTW